MYIYVYLGSVDGAVEQRRQRAAAHAHVGLHGELLEPHLHLLHADPQPAQISARTHHPTKPASSIDPCMRSLHAYLSFFSRSISRKRRLSSWVSGGGGLTRISGACSASLLYSIILSEPEMTPRSANGGGGYFVLDGVSMGLHVHGHI